MTLPKRWDEEIEEESIDFLSRIFLNENFSSTSHTPTKINRQAFIDKSYDGEF